MYIRGVRQKALTFTSLRFLFRNSCVRFRCICTGICEEGGKRSLFDEHFESINFVIVRFPINKFIVFAPQGRFICFSLYLVYVFGFEAVFIICNVSECAVL